ncbi:MAG: hypothetical protein GY708_21480 [Actinomycetia bacterium]|nr:hypothetical protein [Actinomycetes bacterium]MCP4961474.1 hypothetical protein [Actinomycetes bacterium]
MRVAAVALLAAVTVSGGVHVERALAQTDPTSSTVGDLDDILLESPAYKAAVADLEQTEAVIERSETRIAQIDHQLIDLRSARTQLSDGLPVLEERIEAARDSLIEAEADLTDLIVLRYVLEGGDPELAAMTAPASEAAGADRRKLVIETVASGRRHRITRTATILEDAEFAARTAADSHLTVAERISSLEAELALNVEALEAARGALPGMEALVEEERQVSRVTGSDLTLVALDAYLKAARSMATEQPQCHIDWTLLAGIGRVESRHGTYRGSALQPDGTALPGIIGIALDGQFNTVVIMDSDGGALDADTVHDRAVGPMQFIPSTWRAFGVDANSDGVADPQNIHDAALAAARYLCRKGPLDVDTNQVSAILTYNNSNVYVRSVQAHARNYAELGISTEM